MSRGCKNYSQVRSTFFPFSEPTFRYLKDYLYDLDLLHMNVCLTVITPSWIIKLKTTWCVKLDFMTATANRFNLNELCYQSDFRKLYLRLKLINTNTHWFCSSLSLVSWLFSVVFCFVLCCVHSHEHIVCFFFHFHQ